MFYSKNFASFRKSKGLTLEEIGKKIGVSKVAVKYWEDGSVQPKTKNIHKLAKILGCSVIDISDLPPEKEWLKNNEDLILSDEDVAIIKFYQDPQNKLRRYELLAEMERLKHPVIRYENSDAGKHKMAAEESAEYGKKKSKAHVA